MSSTPESNADHLAVACVVEASLLLALEWHRVLVEYVHPLLKRLNELHPSHQFRLGFVAYGAADTRPQPLLSKKFFAPLPQISKELREEPSKLGIGQTNSGNGQGLSALEGLVAGIELFDMLMMSSNFSGNHGQSQSTQKENRSFIFHILHIAASPPDHAQRPQHNTLNHLDSVNWDSIASELKKRKINLSLISLRKIPQFQELQSSVAGPGVQSPWFNVRTPHILSLAGFPAPQRTGTKRLPDTTLSDQGSDPKRPKVVAEPISKTSSASPALTSARIPQNQRPSQPVSSQLQPLQSTVTSSQHSSSAQSVQGPVSTPASTSATVTPSVPLPPSGPSTLAVNAEILDQIVTPTGFTFGQMMERHKVLERDIATIESQASNAQNTGQTAILAGLQKDLAHKIHIRDQIKMLLRQHYQKVLQTREAHTVQAGPPVLPVPEEPGQSTQSQPLNITSTQRPAGPTTEEQKPAVSDSQLLSQIWPSRGGTTSTPSGSASETAAHQAQLHPTSDMAAQAQKLIEKRGIRPPVFGPSSGPMSHESGINTNGVTNAQLMQSLTTPAWHGTFSFTFPKPSGQAPNELHVHVHATITPTLSDVRTDTWPKHLTLIPCKEPLKDTAELANWLKRHKARTHLVQFRSNPNTADGPINDQKFLSLHKFMADHRIYVYAGWQLPSGKFAHNIIIFPMSSILAGAAFPEGLPDLPGSGNILEGNVGIPPSVEEAKPQPASGINIPAALITRLRGLEPTKQKQIITHYLRTQQEQLRKQQLQLQQTQPTATISQNLNTFGISTSSNPYGTAPNMPANLLMNTNVDGPSPSGVYNTGGGTVNYEMLQSFMQRNAEGSTSQGMNIS